MTFPPEKLKPKTKNFFFSMTTRRLAESVEGLNSSLALAAGDLWPKKGAPICWRVRSLRLIKVSQLETVYPERYCKDVLMVSKEVQPRKWVCTWKVTLLCGKSWQNALKVCISSCGIVVVNFCGVTLSFESYCQTRAGFPKLGYMFHWWYIFLSEGILLRLAIDGEICL